MAVSDLRSIVLSCLQAVAPEAKLAGIDPSRSFNEQLDMDSVDYLNFIMGIEEALGIRIVEADYPKFSNLDGCLATLASLVGNEGACSVP